MALRRRFVFRAAISLALLFLVLAIAHNLWLPVFGRALVHDDGPSKADIALILGGDYWGKRVETAGNLVRHGYVPKVLVSGPPGFYGFHESDLALTFAVKKGFPAEWFEAFPHDALSTRDEAYAILPELKRRGLKRVLIVTSNFHTARARRTFLAAEKDLGGGPELRFVAAPDQFFHPDTWWRDRESQKVVFFEWCKTLAAALGR